MFLWFVEINCRKFHEVMFVNDITQNIFKKGKCIFRTVHFYIYESLKHNITLNNYNLPDSI